MLLGNTEIPTEQIGDLYQLEGVIIGDGSKSIAMVLPFISADELDPSTLLVEFPTDSEWQTWLTQSDDPVTPIGVTEADGKLVKAMVRKSSRQVDESTKWKVYKRDSYTCRYCGKSGVPMTVDHYLAQKFGGLTTYDNLLTSCRPCNKRKGHKTIEEWKQYCQSKGLKNGSEA